MTSRERAIATLSHMEPDRVPIDIRGGTSTSVVVEASENLKKLLGVSGETKLLSKMYRSAQLDECVMRRLGSDCYPSRGGSPLNWAPPRSEPGTFIDVWGVRWKQVYYREDSYFWEAARSPLASASIEDSETYEWPDPTDPGYTAGLAEEARRLHEQTDYAIEASCGFYSFWELACNLRGFEQILTDLAVDREFVSAVFSKLLSVNLAGTERFPEAAGACIHIVRAADDLGSQNGPLMSPALFRKLFKPVYQQYFDFVKSKTSAKIGFHSDGNIVSLLDDFVEIGIDAINPVQPSALGDTGVLKHRFGDKLASVGAIDAQTVLPRESAKEVSAGVRQRIQDLGPGGYVLAAVHSIQVDVRPENVLAMADAARRFGVYPLRA